MFIKFTPLRFSTNLENDTPSYTELDKVTINRKYFDTGISPNDLDLTKKISINYKVNITAESKHIFGSRVAYQESQFCSSMNATGNVLRVDIGSKSFNCGVTSGKYSITQTYNNDNVTVDILNIDTGEHVYTGSGTTSEIDNQYSFIVGGWNNAGSILATFKGDFYWMNISEDENIKYSFKFRKVDGEIKMYCPQTNLYYDVKGDGTIE